MRILKVESTRHKGCGCGAQNEERLGCFVGHDKRSCQKKVNIGTGSTGEALAVIEVPASTQNTVVALCLLCFNVLHWRSTCVLYNYLDYVRRAGMRN